MRRRRFLKTMGLSCCAAPMIASGRLLAAPQDYQGRFLVTVQADGAWDATSFCDPKMNVPGNAEINTWARSRDTDMAGNIPYAPFAGNQAFFAKFRDYMLVINGIDTQTNAHAVGVLHSWSGRNAEGYPSLPALHSSAAAPELPMTYLSFGGYGQTSNLVRTTIVNDISPLGPVLRPNATEWDPNQNIRMEEANALIREARQARLQRLMAAPGKLPRRDYNLQAHFAALASSEDLRAFADILPAPEDLQQPAQIGNFYTNTLQQAQIAVLAFKSGAASAADLYMSGFDTHADHDRDHEPLMAGLTQAIDYLWDYAEEHGIAERLTVVVSSDFGRTPYYNSYAGKDHWPITSMLIMEKNAPWGNRVVGMTDEGHNALRVNPATLQRDDGNGTIIYPKHIHKALRRHLGIDGYAEAAGFPFANTEDFDFFNPQLSTV